MKNTEQQRANRAYYLRNGRCPRCGGKNPLANGRVLCLECQQKHDKWQQDHRAQWAAEGRCTRCGRERDGKYTLCPKCREYMSDIRRDNAANAKKRRDGFRAIGFCTRCGKTWAEPGKAWCQKCLDEHKSYCKQEAYRQKARERRQARIDAGLCIDCGAPTEGHQRCERCLEMRRDSMTKYRIIQRIKREADRARGAI